MSKSNQSLNDIKSDLQKYISDTSEDEEIDLERQLELDNLELFIDGIKRYMIPGSHINKKPNVMDKLYTIFLLYNFGVLCSTLN